MTLCFLSEGAVVPQFLFVEIGGNFTAFCLWDTSAGSLEGVVCNGEISCITSQCW